jgi:hypothetical protein
MNKLILFIPIMILFTEVNLTFGQTAEEKAEFAEKARRLFDMGIATVESANSNEDYNKAVNEFKNAMTNSLYGGIYEVLSPSIHYNLAMIYENMEQYDKASFELTMYISIKPPPDDVEEVKEIIKNLDIKSEQFVNPKTLTGIWYFSIPRESSEPRIEIRFNNNTGKAEIRCLTSEAWEDNIPAGEFVSAEWDIFEKKLLVVDAPYYTCEKNLDPNWCMHKVNLSLIRTGENKLEGELSDTGVIYQIVDKPEIFSSSGKVVFERYIE